MSGASTQQITIKMPRPLQGIIGNDVWCSIIDAIPGVTFCVSKWVEADIPSGEASTSERFIKAVGKEKAGEIREKLGPTFTIPRARLPKNGKTSNARRIITLALGSEVSDKIFNEFGGQIINLRNNHKKSRDDKAETFKKMVGKEAYIKIYQKCARRQIHVPLSRIYTIGGDIKKFQLDDEQKRWPQSLQTIARAIGKEASLKLVENFSGKLLYVPKNVTDCGDISKAIGIEGACILARELGGNIYCVPTLHNKGKKADILELYDKGAMSITQIAIQVGVSNRYARKVING
jgi:hypothetical protein